MPEGYKVLQEGKAKILQHGNDVFYNNAQVTNRDLSILVIKHFIAKRQEEIANGTLKPSRKLKGKRDKAAAAPVSGKDAGNPAEAAAPSTTGTGNGNGVTVLEGLSATGLRAIRYALEMEGVQRIDANDLVSTFRTLSNVHIYLI